MQTIKLLLAFSALQVADSFRPQCLPSSSSSSSQSRSLALNLHKHDDVVNTFDAVQRRAATWIATFGVTLSIVASPAFADGATKDFKFPPIDASDKNRCVLKSGSAMGQANAARDKLYDLRQCKLPGANAVGFDLSGVIMTNTDLSKANLKEAYFSKGFLRDSNFDGADFSNAIVDRANFQGSSLRGTIFTNAVLTGTSFDGADVEGADFTEAAIGYNDVRYLCKNPTLKGENPTTGADTRLSVGCN